MMSRISVVVVLALVIVVATFAAATRPAAAEGTPAPTPARAGSGPGPTGNSTPSIPGSSTRQTKPVIVDTDAALDDWLALLYVLQRPDVDIRAITVSGAGEAHCASGVRNVLNLLELAGRPTIPVACGRDTPLQCNHVFPDAWRNEMDNMLGMTLPVNPNPPAPMTAVEMLTRTVQDSPQKMTLITLGPLTNVAEALQASPALADKLEMIYVMGGAVGVPGNMNVPDFASDNLVAEWNLYVDPHAAAAVFGSGAPVTIVALDATNHAPMTREFYDRLSADRLTPHAEFAYQVLTKMVDLIDIGEYYFWDPLAAGVGVDENLVTTDERNVFVFTEEGPECGRTIERDDGPRIRVCIEADGARFEQYFLDTLNGRIN